MTTTESRMTLAFTALLIVLCLVFYHAGRLHERKQQIQAQTQGVTP